MESLSAKQKLSLLQKEYRKFFKEVMKSLKIKTLKGQDKETLAKLFNTVKKQWPKAKKAILKSAKQPAKKSHASVEVSESASKKLSNLQRAYQSFFRKMLKKYEVKSPAELSDYEKLDFFSDIKSGWAKERASLSSVSESSSFESLSAKQKLSLLQKEYRKFFKALLKKYKVTSPAKLSVAEKKEFFGSIKKDWPKAKKAILKSAKQPAKKAK